MNYQAKATPSSGVGRRAVSVSAMALALACLLGPSAIAAEVPAATAVEDAGGVVEVEFWHSMNNVNGQVLQELVDQFNAANEGKIKIMPVFQGGYDDNISKFKASVQAGATPALIQIYEIGTQFMKDSGLTIAMGDFAARDSVDLDYLQKTFRSYYTIDGTLWAIPMNGSVPVMYYNKTAFEKAGLDPNDPPGTLEEIRAAAEKLSAVNGGPVQYGFGSPMYSWLLEEFSSASGVLLCSPDNGRGAARVDTANLADETLVNLAAWWRGMVDDGLAGNLGRASQQARDAFKAGQTAMNLEATVTLIANADAAAAAGFELGVGAFPTAASAEVGAQFGPTIGGAALWVVGEGHTPAQAEAAWRFAHWFSQPSTQAHWHTKTGYYPTAAKVFEEPIEKEWLAKYPIFQVAIDSLEKAPAVAATSGCAVGVMPQLRKTFEDGFERAVLGEDPKAALQEAADTINADIKKYNASVGG
jgi:sn-glycerol 3-phosphate transport system substrate-binding protein